MDATTAKDLADANNFEAEVASNKANYLRNINSEIVKRAERNQYVLVLALSDLQYRSDIEGLGYTVEEIIKDNIPSVNICWASVAEPV